MKKMANMNGTRTGDTASRDRRAGRLSPEVEEFLRMLQAIEERPDASPKDGEGR
jgi:hypothetical protein